MKRLPGTFQGVPVHRGKGMNSKALDKLVDESAHGQWENRGDFFAVVNEDCLGDRFSTADIKVFTLLSDALTYAKACGNGNVDHRVLRCSTAALIVATENEL